MQKNNGALGRGRRVKYPARVNVYLPQEAYDRMAAWSVRLDLSMGTIAREALVEGLDRWIARERKAAPDPSRKDGAA